jgi:DNA-binding IscR family transcriptional regulator
MQTPAIANQIDVPKSETAKILQLLVWGGFVSSRRGTKGGFRLAMPAEEITMGEVINFFMTRHPKPPKESAPVMRALEESMAGAQAKFANLTLSAVIKFPASKPKTRVHASGSKHRSRNA